MLYAEPHKPCFLPDLAAFVLLNVECSILCEKRESTVSQGWALARAHRFLEVAYSVFICIVCVSEEGPSALLGLT